MTSPFRLVGSAMKLGATHPILRSSTTTRPRAPRKIGRGPATWTSSTRVDHQPFRWDANGFYRILGVDPWCERIELVRAYHEVGGQSDPRVTYAFKLLLNKETRKRYDAIPLGSFWSGDPALFRAVSGLDDEHEVVEYDDEWAYYLDADMPQPVGDDWPLAAWQAVISKATTEVGLDWLHICLGVTNSDPRVTLVGYNIVIFLRVDMELSEPYARQIASDLLAISTR